MTRRRRSAKSYPRRGLVAALVLALAAGCTKPESTTLSEKPLPHVRVVEVTAAEPRPRSRHLAPLLPHRRARLSPRSGGQVTALLVDEEQRVLAGAPLLRFADDDPRGNLIAAKAGIERVQEALRDAELELATAKVLAAKGIGTTREIERLATQRAGLEAQLREAKGNMLRARDRIGAAVLEAPFAGVITQVSTEEGEYVAPGSVAMVLAQLDPIAVEVPLTQREIAAVDGAQAGLDFVAHVRGIQIEPELEWIRSESAGSDATFTARLRLPNPELLLRAGELVEIEVFGASGEAQLAVPATAVRWLGEAAYVLRVTGGIIERVDVEVLDDSEDVVLVAGALAVGDAVVRTGPVALRPGDAVVVVASDAPSILESPGAPVAVR